ncbi:MAG: glycyl-radical enzyme activating protein [bacterium]
MNRPLVIDIKRHALAGSSGIRTTIFFKGCQLNCLWCHNPEAIDPDMEIGFYPSKCLLCGDCVDVCPTKACSLDNPARIDRERCIRCGRCTEVCTGLSLQRIGTYYSPEQILELVLQDQQLFRGLDGGVTLSGGEPTLHMDYISILLRMLKKDGVHTAIETNGLFSGAEFQKTILEFLDLIYFDVKLVHPDLHRLYTGQGNEQILDNLTMLMSLCPEKMIPRIPLVPGITTTNEARQSMSVLFRKLSIKEYALLPYNSLGHAKLQTLGKTPLMLPGPAKENLSRREGDRSPVAAQ